MKRVALLALALAGCTTPRTAIVHCITPEQFEKLKSEAPPKVREQLTGKADEDIRIIAGSNIRLRAYSDGLLGVLGGCVG